MGEMVSYPGSGGAREAYLAVPTGGLGAAVIVIQESWGLIPHIKALADRFAAAGFTALAPDLPYGVDAAALRAGVDQPTMDEAGRDVAAAAAYLAARPEVTARVGAAGFRSGGSLALWSATLSDLIVAAVAFYPALPWVRMSPAWPNYTGKAALIHCSEEEGGSGAPGIHTAASAIKDGGGEVSLQDYPGARDAFFNDDRPEVYNAAAAASAWARTLEFFRSRLE